MAQFEGFKIGNTVFPIKAKGLTLSENKIWSANTGRGADGTMQGTLIAIKKKLEITLPPLQAATARALRDIVSDSTAFVTAYYNDLGETKSIEGYFGDAEFPIYSADANGNALVLDAKFSFIER